MSPSRVTRIGQRALHAARTRTRRGVTWLDDLLDNHIVPRVVALSIHRYQLLGSLVLWAGAVVFWRSGALYAISNQYLSGLGTLVAIVVLRQTLAHRSENGELHARHRDDIQSLRDHHEEEMAAMQAQMAELLGRLSAVEAPHTTEQPVQRARRRRRRTPTTEKE